MKFHETSSRGPSCPMWIDRQRDREADLTKLMFTFRNFVKTLKMNVCGLAFRSVAGAGIVLSTTTTCTLVVGSK